MFIGFSVHKVLAFNLCDQAFSFSLLGRALLCMSECPSYLHVSGRCFSVGSSGTAISCFLMNTVLCIMLPQQKNVHLPQENRGIGQETPIWAFGQAYI